MRVEFEDRPSRSHISRPSGIAAFLLRHKIARSESSANRILIVVGITIIIVSIALFIVAYNNANVKQSIYNFPDELISRFPPELQNKILNVIYSAKK